MVQVVVETGYGDWPRIEGTSDLVGQRGDLELVQLLLRHQAAPMGAAPAAAAVCTAAKNAALVGSETMLQWLTARPGGLSAQPEDNQSPCLLPACLPGATGPR